jgi:hypothetical protein
MNPKKKSRRYRVLVSIHALDLAISRFTHSLAYTLYSTYKERIMVLRICGSFKAAKRLCPKIVNPQIATSAEGLQICEIFKFANLWICDFELICGLPTFGIYTHSIYTSGSWT